MSVYEGVHVAEGVPHTAKTLRVVLKRLDMREVRASGLQSTGRAGGDSVDRGINKHLETQRHRVCKKKVHMCRFCGKVFQNSLGVVHHEFLHTGEQNLYSKTKLC